MILVKNSLRGSSFAIKGYVVKTYITLLGSKTCEMYGGIIRSMP